MDYRYGPLAQKFYLVLSPPQPGDSAADVERLVSALGQHLGGAAVRVPLAVMRRIPHVLREAGWHVTATVGAFAPGYWELIDLEPGDTTGRLFGLAVDAGTTVLAACLVDLCTGEVLAEDAAGNGQVAEGEDLLTRIWLAHEPEGLARLQKAALLSLNALLEHLARRCGISPREIVAAAVGANTTMVHLLLGLDPFYVCLVPHVPVVKEPGAIPAGEIGLAVNPRAPVYFLPAVAGYLGGDVVGGLLACGLHRQEELSLFVDIGTNGEMVLGNREWLLGCAGAAGPALEGGVAACGMRAAPGAIDRVRIDAATGEVRYTTIGGGPPAGLCGSGLVDCLAEMLLAGIIDRAGRFTGGREKFVLVPAEDTAAGREIAVTQTDIQNFLRTKGAVNAALELLLESVGLSPGDIGRFYAAGAFGEHLDVEAAVTIGLYPDLPREKMVRLGNASLEGAKLALLSAEAREEAATLARRITYIELNDSQAFMNKFVGSRFFPHTNIDLYPTVKAKLAARGLLKGN